MTTNQEFFTYKNYFGSTEISHEDKCLVGKIQYIDDLVIYEGSNYEELETEFHKAVDEYLAFCVEIGKRPGKSYSGSFNVRIGAELHCNAARAAKQKGISLNEFIRLTVEQALTERPNIVANAVAKFWANTDQYSWLQPESVFINYLQKMYSKPYELLDYPQESVVSPSTSNSTHHLSLAYSADNRREA